jgi:hypothetical protein
LTENQIKAIWKHAELGKLLDLEYYNEKWKIAEENGFITGSTIMDNFDMSELLEIIGVHPKKIAWEDYRLEFPDDGDDGYEAFLVKHNNWEKLLREC